jgi:hypothetical protein
MNAARIVLLVFGILFVLAAFGLILGGGIVLAIDSSFKDEQGYFVTGFQPLEADSPVVISQPAEIRMQTGWDRRNRNPVTLKIEAYNDNSAKEVFIGIARESDLSQYLKDKAYDEITGFDFPADKIEVKHHEGASGAPLPGAQSFWVASTSGSGNQTLTWNIASGNYSLAIMNADGSSPVEAHVSVGAKIPGIVNAVGIGLLVGGIVLLVIGGVMIFFAARGW